MIDKTLKIAEVAALYKCSTTTVRAKYKARTIPQPLKRTGKKEVLLWRAADIEKHLGIQSSAHTSPAEEMLSAIQKMIDETVHRYMATHGIHKQH